MKGKIIIGFLFIWSMAFSQGLEVMELTCEFLENPIGLDEEVPRFSWKLVPENDVQEVLQTAYQIQVFKQGATADAEFVWDSEKTRSSESVLVPYGGDTLEAKTRYYWRVRVWDNRARQSEWSTPAYWETGLMRTEWEAQWITANLPEADSIDNPAHYLRRAVDINKPIQKARVYITSKGLYELAINGRKVTEDVFTPGYTSFNKRLQYQVYDVTTLLSQSENILGVMLGDGWYRGRFGFSGNRRNFYGKDLELLLQLEIEYKDGTTEMITSDDQWKSNTGPIRMSNIYDGEIYDANYDLGNWNSPGYNVSGWKGVNYTESGYDNIVPTVGLPIRKIETLPAQNLFKTPNEEIVIDFGQNLVGRVRMNIPGKTGDTITIYHAEVLDQEGNFYIDNLRSADQKVQYIFGKDGRIVYEPIFTFQGFRYIMIEGFKSNFKQEDFEAVVIHSDMKETGTFECTDPMINQLQSNIKWGQKGNFLDVPTDCPQRDERMGWTGDAQAFASTAMFNYDVAAFYKKWMLDVAADQKDNGSVPFVVPDVLGGNGSTGWADVVTILPYTQYLKYGDKRILEDHYVNMRGWVDFLKNLAGDDHIVNDGFHFGDWLFFIHPSDWNAKPGYTDIDYIATAFFAYSTSLLVKTAELLDKSDDVAKYSAMKEQIITEFQDEFITPSGRLSPHSQTAYILALQFGLLPDDKIENAVKYLVADIEKRGGHLSTGFLGTPYIAEVLTRYGHEDVAYKLLFRKEYPSWLYPVTKGATTIWERWDGIKPDGSFQDIRMNSFNHYAYGAIGNWMYTSVAGINSDPEAPGYKKIIIQPIPTNELGYATATLDSPYGLIKSSWYWENDQFKLNVTIPPNTTAEIHLPGSDEVKEVGSGNYSF